MNVEGGLRYCLLIPTWKRWRATASDQGQAIFQMVYVSFPVQVLCLSPPPLPQQTVQLGWSRNSVFAILRNTKLDKVEFLFLETSRNLVKYLVKVCRFRSAKFRAINENFVTFLSAINAIMFHLFLDSCLRKIGNDLLYTYSVQLCTYLK